MFYRVTAQEKARELGIVGFVENMPDGSVHIEACGSEESLRLFLDWCRIGPPDARVLDVLYTEIHVSNFTDFKVQ